MLTQTGAISQQAREILLKCATEARAVEHQQTIEGRQAGPSIWQLPSEVGLGNVNALDGRWQRGVAQHTSEGVVVELQRLQAAE